MRGIVLVLIMLAGFTGCSERPPFPTTGRLSNEQLDWYAAKATKWLKTEGWRYGWERKTIDSTHPIRSELSEDGRTVTVRLPTHVRANSHRYIMVVLDRSTGKITGSSEGKVISDTF